MNMATLAEWAGMDNTDAEAAVTGVPAVGDPNDPQHVPAVVAQPAFLGTLASFLAYCGAGPNSHFRSLASVTSQDFDTYITGWTIRGRAPNIMQLGAAKCAHRTARCLCKLDQWPEELLALQIQQQQQQLAPPPQQPPQQSTWHGNPLGPAGSLINVPTVTVSEILDQRVGETITYIEDAEWLKARAEYRRQMDTMPSELCDYTREQLTALLHVINTHRGPYVDFAVFGPFGARRLKRHAMTGMLFNQGGLLHKVELFGPPCIEDWLESWSVFGAIMISIKAMSRPTLKAYKAWMSWAAKMYGPLVWPLLYQTDVRCRSERIPMLRDELVAAHSTSITAGQPSSFDAARPWDAAYKAAITGDSSTAWWNQQFSRKLCSSSPRRRPCIR